MSFFIKLNVKRIVFLFFLTTNLFYSQKRKLELSEKLNHAISILPKNKEEALKEIVKVCRETNCEGHEKLWLKANLILADIYRDNANYKGSNLVFNKILQKQIPITNDTLAKIYFKKGGNFQNDKLIDSALYSYKKALLISKKVKGKQALKAKINANLGGIYYLIANLNPKVKKDKKANLFYNSKAIEHCEIAANYQKEIGNKEIEVGILNNVASIYLMQGNVGKALEKLKYVLQEAGFSQSELFRKARNSAYINLSYAYNQLGDYKKAFAYQDKFISLNDSIAKEQKYKEISEIHTKYEAEENEKQAAIEYEKRKNAEFVSYIFAVLSLLLLAAGFVLFKLYRLNKKNYELKANQKLLLQQQAIAKIREDEKSKLLVATLDGRLKERKSISGILHDSVSALLSAAKLHMFVAEKKLNKPFEELQKAEKVVGEAQEIIRNLSHKLISSVLLKFGLKHYISDLSKKLSNPDLVITHQIENINRYDENFELKVHNIINELINNVIKHSGASKAQINIKQVNNELELEITDNGVGFDLDEIKNKKGVGVSQVIARVEALNGTIDFIRNTQNFKVLIKLPIVV